ncbi:Homocysteine S-methyltransferase [uncultured Mycobacterium sp.]|uniref:Homocysteine S-methyltransferase n=1 Tax=uncultured Mycobacterium sp. TaxID=171292 RepID=A0A1Y5PTJ3_9MYCO|nr:Homocysteine S-methyltransferase [uncultured Mycobacterium sp.]
MAFAVPHTTVLILDGGLATELETRGHDLSDDLWSARLLVDSPQEIVAVHEAFYRAGADIATTASYQASFNGFAERGFTRGEVARLLVRSVELARTARDNVGRGGWVAASVGPYGAALANGEEYVGRYGLTAGQLAEWHRPRLEVLVSAQPDVLGLETVPDVDEAEALAGLVHEFGVPAWLSYTIAGGYTRAGQPLDQAFAVAAEVPEIVAVGVNCSAPADVLGAVEVARQVTGKPVIVYPNSGEEWDGLRRTWVGNGSFNANAATQWAAAGANIIGGCCRVRPADIAEIKRSGPRASGTPGRCR